ncbi:hypothetical protein GCM10022415_15810 [Knoellia locipacati]|uniref:Uncharacterized protein n=1 Tax=Knoellia locipacati TaxID=882824 RepID=A0A512T028_9MICO|nr:hypothetical protein KLO01_15780 [Knoellia locipacati]
MRVGLLTFLLVILGGAAAAARPSIPGLPDCKEAPVAEYPDRGVSGMLDPAPSPVPVARDPFAPQRTTSIYDQYGYAGLRWSTYDLGCGGSVRNPEAAADTMVGNMAMSAAVFVTSLSNGIHNAVSNPKDYMGPLDRVVDRVSERMNEAIWTPWGGVALLGVVGLLLVYSTRGQLSSVVSGGLWAMLVLAVLSGLAAYPGRAASFFDETVTQTIGNLQASSAGVVSDAEGGPGRSQGALAVDTVLYQNWLRGELGSSEGAAAERWGPRLFGATALTRAEAASSRDPERAKEISESKAEAFTEVADEIQEQDPSTYAVLQGKAGGRAGTGVLTLLGSLFTVGFRLIADAFLVAGLVMLRLLVMFFPAAAVVGIIAPLSSVVRRIGNIGAASLVNVIAFSAGSVIHTAAISALLSTADGPGMSVMALLLCLVLTVAAFVLMMPFLSMTQMLGGQSRRGLLRSVRQNVVRYAVSRKATEDGTSDVLEEQVGRRSMPADGSPGRRVADPPRAETYQRPTPVWDITSDGVQWRHMSDGDAGGSVFVSQPRQQLSQGGDDAARSSSDPIAPPPDGPKGTEPSPSRHRLLVGQVVGQEQDRARRMHIVRPHEGNASLRHDGSMGHDIFDPGIGRSDDREAS